MADLLYTINPLHETRQTKEASGTPETVCSVRPSISGGIPQTRSRIEASATVRFGVCAPEIVRSETRQDVTRGDSL